MRERKEGGREGGKEGRRKGAREEVADVNSKFNASPPTHLFHFVTHYEKLIQTCSQMNVKVVGFSPSEGLFDV